MAIKATTVATSQYSTTSSKLAARLAIHAYSTNTQSWFAWVGSKLPAEGKFLEVGAGTGELWKHVDHSHKTLTLTDFSSAMCEQLRQVPGARVEQCDATHLPFTDSSFDCVIANHMLYHVDEPEAALKEFSRVLRPGGKLILALNGRDHLDELFTIGNKIGRPSLILKAAPITAETAADKISQHFDDVSEERFPADLAVPNAGPIEAYLGSLRDEDLDSSQTEMVQQIVNEHVREKGDFVVKMNMVLFIGTRRTT